MRQRRIFTTSENAWEGMLLEIRSAKKSVFLEMYIFEDDAKGNEFFSALEDAAHRGVRVVALFDTVGSFGSFALEGEALARLREAGAEVLFCSFFLQRMHRKVLVIDERVAFIGGVNVGRKYARWKDLQVRVTGPVLPAILRSFSRMYRECGGTNDLGIESRGHQGPIRRAKMWFVDHGVGRRKHHFRKYYEERLSKAKKSIVMVTPYLFPPRWLIARLHQAILRGVTVDIVIPESTDYRFVNGVNRSYATSLVALGAKVHLVKSMIHAKAMIVDGEEGVIGSQNLDMLSFHVNIEAGVFFNDPEMVKELEEAIEGWKKRSDSFGRVAPDVFALV